MLTNKRYTVILSAEQASASATANLIASEALALYFKNVLCLTAQSAIGCYKGEQETSFIIHTDCSATAQGLMLYATIHLNQESVLISDNELADIRLFFGDQFKPLIAIGSHLVPSKGDGENYTVLNGKAWSVK